MSHTLIQRRDLDFLLWEWLRLDAVLQRPRFVHHDRETIGAMLDLSERLALETFLPHYKDADREEPQLDRNGDVHVLPAIATALRQYADVGLFGAGFAESAGGLQLPAVAAAASLAQFMAANVATAAYVMLSVANARLIMLFGSAAQVRAFALPQIEGRALGTMCLSEPQAGSSLADINTRAMADGEDGLGKRYRLRGSKMWISAGDHDITRDIVHLVLAKVPGLDGQLPRGTRGISLFIVPKWLAGDGGRNDVVAAGLNHKMGYHGTANCLMNFGEGRYRPFGGAGAVGYLVGDVGQGLAIMFRMMNEARINVGLGAAAAGYRGYRLALRYARERLQGRSASGGSDSAVAIIEHPDVQRMLLAQKAYVEGALSLVLYCAALVDREAEEPDAAELLALLTPVAKSWPSEWGLAANDLAIQVHGGYGYTRDFDVEQLYRDNRLNPIHEGTTGIQALDLLNRKLLQGNGHALGLLRNEIRSSVARARGLEELAPHALALDAAWTQIDRTIATLRQAPAMRALANATAFLQGFGHAIVGWLWLDQSLACARDSGGDAAAFYAGKHRACRFFFECELPKVSVWLTFAASLSDVANGVPVDQF